MAAKLKCIKTVAGHFVEGQIIVPYAETPVEYIVQGMEGSNMDHHIKKDGAFIAQHFEIIK